MTRTFAAAALLTLAVTFAAPPAMAASVNVKNCSNAEIDVELRNGETPTGPVRDSVEGLAHGDDWTGSCQSTDFCWMTVELPLFGTVDAQASGERCVLPPSTGSVVQSLMSLCTC